jgi:hypothetical protein
VDKDKIILHKKVRRSNRKTKKEFSNFKVYYVNTRGIKSKLNSVERISNELKPQVICITETMLGEKEKVDLPGYKNFYNSNKSGKGGIIIAIKNELKEVTVEVEKTNEKHQSLWIKIDNKTNKINIGCIYAPQENKATIKTLNDVYEDIESHKKARQKNERVIVTGDFNAKVGPNIPGNKEELSKSGKILMKMVLEQDLTLLNMCTKCKGKWTRISGDKKSIIDYAMTRQEDEKYVSKIVIDEEKEYTPSHKDGKKIIYSDHCAIITEINWTEANIERCKSNSYKIITEKSMDMIIIATESGILTKIAEEETPIDEKYDKWQVELSRIIDEASEVRKVRKKKVLKIERKLNLVKKAIRKKQKWSRNEKKSQIRLINHHEVRINAIKACS